MPPVLLVLLTPVANLPPVSTTPAANLANNGNNIRLQTPESELEGKNFYMFPLLPKGDQTKLLKFFWLKIFSICHRCRWHRWKNFSREYLREFSKKFETVLMEYSGAGGNWFMKRTRSKKSRDTVPLSFNILIFDQFCVNTFTMVLWTVKQISD